MENEMKKLNLFGINFGIAFNLLITSFIFI